MAAGTPAAELREQSSEELTTKLREAMRRAIHKLPMKCRIVTREGAEG